MQRSSTFTVLFFLTMIICACGKPDEPPGFAQQINIEAEKTREFLRNIDSLLSDLSQERSSTNMISQDGIKVKINRIKELQDSLKTSLDYLQASGFQDSILSKYILIQRDLDSKKKEIIALSQQIQVKDTIVKNLQTAPALCFVGTYKRLREMNVVEYIRSKERPVSGPEPEDFFKIIRIGNPQSQKEIDLLFDNNKHQFKEVLSAHANRKNTWSVKGHSLVIEEPSQFWQGDRHIVIEIEKK